MNITTDFIGRSQALIELFTAAFTASEGPKEGALIGELVRSLLTETPEQDIRVFCAEVEGKPIGAAIFTRLTYPEDRILYSCCLQWPLPQRDKGKG